MRLSSGYSSATCTTFIPEGPGRLSGSMGSALAAAAAWLPPAAAAAAPPSVLLPGGRKTTVAGDFCVSPPLSTDAWPENPAGTPRSDGFLRSIYPL